MTVVEAIAIIILILAILCLVYYYLKNINALDLSNATPESISSIFNSRDSRPKEEYYAGAADSDIKVKIIKEIDDESEKTSTVDKIKGSIKDINTDAFSKRLDTFLDEKSEELIENWSLATTDDLVSLEERCISACNNIDDLEKRFSQYTKVTDEKIEDLDKRLKSLEDIG